MFYPLGKKLKTTLWGGGGGGGMPPVRPRVNKQNKKHLRE